MAMILGATDFEHPVGPTPDLTDVVSVRSVGHLAGEAAAGEAAGFVHIRVVSRALGIAATPSGNVCRQASQRRSEERAQLSTSPGATALELPPQYRAGGVTC